MTQHLWLPLENAWQVIIVMKVQLLISQCYVLLVIIVNKVLLIHSLAPLVRILPLKASHQ